MLTHPNIPSDYPARIKRLRDRFGLTQTRMAEIMGVSFATINRWENSQTKPSSLAWERLARAEEWGIQGLTTDGLDSRTAREDSSEYGSEGLAVTPDFAGNAEAVWSVAEGERLSYGHLFNPAFATETSLIDPLPHQRIAVYGRMLQVPRLRFLLADDAGAGKTIMAGLYIREMVSRRLIRRILIVPPAGLLGNWERELRTLFNLSFRVILGSDARKRNPFVGANSDCLIISVDTMRQPKMFARLQDDQTVPYDLVIFDEAHKLSARQESDFRVRKTERYRLAEALAGVNTTNKRWELNWSCTHLVLLTATPHMGRDYPYYCLWRLLEPEVLSTQDAFESFPAEDRASRFIRRTKEEMVDLEGQPIYPKRVSDTLSYDLSAGPTSEQELYDRTTEYIRSYYSRAKILNRSAARFVMSIFQRRLASSTYAILCSLRRRHEKLSDLIDQIRSGELTEENTVVLNSGPVS